MVLLSDSAGESLAAFCLGEYRLVVEGSPAAEWRAGRARRLFQYLLAHRQRPTAPDTLVEALWPNPDAADPGTSLRVSLHLLRQELARAPGPLGRASVEVSDAGYRLIAPELWVDVEAFERDVAQGRQLEAVGEPAAALASYAHAADLYQGEFLAGAWHQWVRLRRERLKDQFLFAAGRLADAAFASGDYDASIVHCQRMLDADHLHERTYRTLMRCHARLGQLGRVRSWYEVCAEALRSDLGLAPQPETDGLYRSVLGRSTGVLLEMAG